VPCVAATSMPFSRGLLSLLCAREHRDGDVYKGSRFNVLTVVAAVSILTPLAGLVFAWWSYGRLWG